MLLGVSGSVAAIKTVEVARLLAAWADVRVVTTEVGRRFIDGQLPPSIGLYGASLARPAPGQGRHVRRLAACARGVSRPCRSARLRSEKYRVDLMRQVTRGAASYQLASCACVQRCYARLEPPGGQAARRSHGERAAHAAALTARRLAGDEAEWRAWQRVGDEVLHIELRRWADALVLAPLSANTLAKAAHGLADNLLTCVARRGLAPGLRFRVGLGHVLAPLSANTLAKVAHGLANNLLTCVARRVSAPGS